MKEKRITISDIAKEAGVSKTTVSRYLNANYGYMSEETRERIRVIIENHGYIPSSVARTLKSKKSKLIGVIANTLRYQVGAQTITGINDVCSRYGYGTVVCCSNDNLEDEVQAIQLCLNQQVDGIVIIPSENSIQRYQALCEQGIPVVFCTRMITGWPYGGAYVEHEALICEMLSHLSEQGFEKVRLFYDVENFLKQRMANAFAEYAQTHFDMPKEESVVRVGREDAVVSAALNAFLLEYPGKKKAVFAINTNTLFLILKELEEKKVQIPDAMGVCGYDALGWAELVPPGISSIRQPMYQMGVEAGEEMIACLQENRMSQKQVALKGTIYLRDSTRLI